MLRWSSWSAIGFLRLSFFAENAYRGEIKVVARSSVVGLQLRGVILAVEIWIAIWLYVLALLPAAHFCLLSTDDCGTFGSDSGSRRLATLDCNWDRVCGLLIVLQLGAGIFSIVAALLFISALLFAVYGLLKKSRAYRPYQYVVFLD